MRVSILRGFLCWFMLVTVPYFVTGQEVAQQTAGAAILHTQGGVWVNGSEARDSSAVFAGDLVETNAGNSASLSLEGSTVLIGPESVAKFQGDYLELDHGSVSVGTSKSFQVHVNCLRVIPVVNEWTQYDVTDRDRNIQVAAHKLDVNVEHEMGHGKPTPMNASDHASVREGDQHNYDETGICGAPASPTSAGLANPKWLEIGGAGGGALLLCILFCHGSGSKNPVSASTP